MKDALTSKGTSERDDPVERLPFLIGRLSNPKTGCVDLPAAVGASLRASILDRLKGRPPPPDVAQLMGWLDAGDADVVVLRPAAVARLGRMRRRLTPGGVQAFETWAHGTRAGAVPQLRGGRPLPSARPDARATTTRAGTVSRDRVLDRLPLDRWQIEAQAAWREAGRRGIVQAVTGSGKTRLALHAIHHARARGADVDVIVPTRALSDKAPLAIEVQDRGHRGWTSGAG